MANKIVNRVKMTVTGTPGTGTITLGSAVSGFQSMAGAGVVDADTVPYVIEDGSAWELGVGTITVSGSTYTMSRSVTASSNSGSPISASSSALVFITPLAADLQSGTSANNLVRLDGSAKLPTVDGSALTNLNASNIASGTVPASLLPNPTSTTLGGVKSKASITNYFLTQIGTDGSVSSAQPAFTDISGTLSVANGGTGLSGPTGLPAGYIPYGNGTGAFGTNGPFWDSTNSRLGVGTSSPTATLTLPNNVDATAGAVSLFRFYDVGTGAINGIGTSAGSFDLRSVGNFAFYSGSSAIERMRIASDGSVGIGTTSPAAKLDVNAAIVRFGNGSNGGFMQLGSDATAANNYHIGSYGGYFTFYNGNYGAGTQLATLTASGNLGLGVSPSAWVSGSKALQFGLISSLADTSNAYTELSWNSYEYAAGAYKRWYPGTVAASMYRQTSGVHSWHIAGTGAQGSTISFTQAMTLTSAGELLVGDASTYSGSKFYVKGTQTSTNCLVANFLNTSATSTSRIANSILRIASYGSGADTSINFTDTATNNYYFGGYSGTAYVTTNNNQGVKLSAGATSWASDSDERLKNITGPILNAVESLNSLRTVHGNYKTDEDTVRRLFLIAQDVQRVYPEAIDVESGDEQILLLRYSELIPPVIAAIQELAAKVSALEARQ